MCFCQQKILRGGSYSKHERKLSIGKIQMDSVVYVGAIKGMSNQYLGLIPSDATDDEVMQFVKTKIVPFKPGYFKKRNEVFVIINAK